MVMLKILFMVSYKLIFWFICYCIQYGSNFFFLVTHCFSSFVTNFLMFLTYVLFWLIMCDKQFLTKIGRKSLTFLNTAAQGQS